jgi:putative ATP-binding cassette transporter
MEMIQSWLWSARWRLAGALGTSLCSGFCGATQVAIINQTLVAEAAQLPALALEFTVASVLVLVTRWLSHSQFAALSQRTLARLRQHISHQLAHAPLPQLETLGAAGTLAVLTEDVSTLSGFLVVLPRLATSAAILSGCLGYLGLLSWQVFAFTVVIVACVSIGYHWVHTRAIGLLRAARRNEDVLFRHFRALFAGAKELRLHERRREHFLSRLVAGSIESIRALRSRGLTLQIGAGSLGTFLFFALIGLVLFVLGPWLASDASVRSGYAVVLLYLLLPLDTVLGSLPALGRAQVAFENIRRVSAQLPAGNGAAAGAGPVPATRFERVELRGVVHRYRSERDGHGFILGPIDLELRRGEVVFLIGGNGSGKSTLAKLLVGLYAPEVGQVRLNGGTVCDTSQQGYRSHFAAIFSDFFLFEGLLGVEGEELDARARELLVRLDLAHRVSVTNGVFSTTDLSDGQRKRLALLVAWLEDRAAYVFDEWAADQDPNYKEVFYRELLPSLKAAGKAVLVITHDDRYFDLADRCFKLDSGKLTEAPQSLQTGQPAWRTELMAEPAGQ